MVLCRHHKSCVILNRMVQQICLDMSFGALSDATRRGILEQLAWADASISTLAEKFQMTLTGMKKHISVLERAGLVVTKKVGRVRTCRLGPMALEDEMTWIQSYRDLWSARFNELDSVLVALNNQMGAHDGA